MPLLVILHVYEFTFDHRNILISTPPNIFFSSTLSLWWNCSRILSAPPVKCMRYTSLNSIRTAIVFKTKIGAFQFPSCTKSIISVQYKTSCPCPLQNMFRAIAEPSNSTGMPRYLLREPNNKGLSMGNKRSNMPWEMP